VDLHYPLTDLELRRCRWVGQASNRILAQVAGELQPGMTEREIAARLLYEYFLAGMTIDVLIVGADERITKYRHPLPTDNPLRRYALLHPAARRWGLHANVTRLVHFGQPPEEVRRAVGAAQAVAAGVAAMLRPGVRFADVLVEQKRLYESLGYTEEWRNHFQGGITGYTLADPTRALQPEARAVLRQAYDYFITITGAKAEELFLLTEGGVEIASAGHGWPLREVKTERGVVAFPDMLIRE
jgi:antitoxin VapB